VGPGLGSKGAELWVKSTKSFDKSEQMKQAGLFREYGTQGKRTGKSNWSCCYKKREREREVLVRESTKPPMGGRGERDK